MSSINQKSYQKCKEAGKFDPQQEKKSIDRNKPIKDKADGISQKEIEIRSCTSYSVYYEIPKSI